MGTAAYYETAQAVNHFTDRYAEEKERAFCAFIFSLLPGRPDSAIEIGGGSGLHGELISDHVARYTHSDRSDAMCEAARTRGLVSRKINAFNLPQLDEDVVFAIELSTLCRSGRERLRQLREIASAMKDGSHLVMSCNLRTFGYFSPRCPGLEPVAWKVWGIVPRWVWRNWPKAAAAVERFVPFGVRQIVVMRRIPRQSRT